MAYTIKAEKFKVIFFMKWDESLREDQGRKKST